MNQSSKILMIGPDCQGGIASVINSYKDIGLEVNYLASYNGGNIFLQLVVFTSFLFKFLFILFTNKNIEIIHIHSASYGSFLRKSIVLKIAKLFRKKVIFHIHGAEFELFYNKSPKFFQNFITNILNQADFIIALSKQWGEILSNISSNQNIKILYNPTFIKELNHIPSETARFLFMGRIEKRKGVYEIIESTKYLQNNNVIINLYGDGDIDKFKRLIQESAVGEKVQIKGWISGNEKKSVYDNSDVLLLPSFNEGLPMSILEAMAWGLPIISTPIAGIPEAVEDGVNGFLIQPGDAKSLAEKIDVLVNDKDLREKMGRESYRIAKEKFDINVIIKQLQGIYDELLTK